MLLVNQVELLVDKKSFYSKKNIAKESFNISQGRFHSDR